MRIGTKALVTLTLGATLVWASSGFAQSGGLGISGTGGRMGGGLRGGGRGSGGIGSSPAFNPAPSLTPFQLFNPPGSLSAAQTFNPSPSIFRPRSAAVPGSGLDLRRGDGNRFHGNRSAAPAPRSIVPTPTQLAIMPRRIVAAWVGYGIDLLNQDLARFRNGQNWQRHLQLDTLRTALADAPDRPHAPTRRQQLQHILATYDALAKDDDYARVQTLAGFTVVRTGLTELVRDQ